MLRWATFILQKRLTEVFFGYLIFVKFLITLKKKIYENAWKTKSNKLKKIYKENELKVWIKISMTPEEFKKFKEKYNLNVEMGIDYSNNYFYLPSKIYEPTLNTAIAICNCTVYETKLSWISLRFFTKVLITETYEEACEIMDTDFLPKIKYRKMYDRLKKMEGDFDT